MTDSLLVVVGLTQDNEGRPSLWNTHSGSAHTNAIALTCILLVRIPRLYSALSFPLTCCLTCFFINVEPRMMDLNPAARSTPSSMTGTTASGRTGIVTWTRPSTTRSKRTVASRCEGCHQWQEEGKRKDNAKLQQGYISFS